jgi:hypothetical protein
MNTNERFNIGESSALLHVIFPMYPDLEGMNRPPEVGAFLLALRSQNLTEEESETLIPVIAGADTKSS